jgi:hypothetical protein
VTFGHTYLELNALLRSWVGLLLPFVGAGSLGSHGGRSSSCATAGSMSPSKDGVGGVSVGVFNSSERLSRFKDVGERQEKRASVGGGSVGGHMTSVWMSVKGTERQLHCSA